jgi:branched-chain amino acid transport system ATP-binding protein
MALLLDVKSISKSFGGLKAVSDASLSVDEGKIVSLIGPNGAGKTTLFAIISGFLGADSGSVFLNNENITGMKPHRICDKGMVRTFQITQPFASLSTLENIMVGAYKNTSLKAKAKQKATEVAELVGMTHLLNTEANSLTVAGRKRLELARALATDPKLLLLDEVMAGLNPSEIDEIVNIIKIIRDSGVTIFLIEHVMKAVVNLSDYSYVLNDGVLIAHGTPKQIANDPLVIEAYLGQGAAKAMTKNTPTKAKASKTSKKGGKS